MMNIRTLTPKIENRKLIIETLNPKLKPNVHTFNRSKLMAGEGGWCSQQKEWCSHRRRAVRSTQGDGTVVSEQAEGDGGDRAAADEGGWWKG